MSHNCVWSLLEDKAGNIWLGTRNTGLCRFDGKALVGFRKKRNRRTRALRGRCPRPQIVCIL
ncbi:hypothetical protein KK062_12770 [Fulvivirgaceae bacterium PWU5]|uniref:Uncharacterized protein n=1 Tax=Dawidia cretensis TaxID=2782350 RepID=A0AAP2GVJ1_9BACT|nr:hypothetical protein [Dawidia cretensis]